MRKAILLWPLFLVPLLTLALASPVKSKWVRQIFIGTKDKAFYTLRVEQNHPGNYYAWNRGDFLTSNTLTSSGRVITHSTPLRWVRFSKNVNDETLPIRRRDILTTDSLNLQQFLLDKQIDYAFPEHGQFAVTSEGLFMVKDGQEELLLPIENLKSNLEPPTFEWSGDEKLAVSSSVFFHEDFALLTVQYGTQNAETDFVETIVAVPMARYERAKEKLGIK